ncbi:dihydroxyacetone kinase subunit L [bacterium]|nr:MAG: dihydroxyacetone kinase subunit L [bacterium]
MKDFAGLFAGGLANLQQQSKARLGDKTLMDALIPAVEALQAQSAHTQDILVALRAGAQAARAGSNATATLVAHFGRAKYQGERTLGKLDPGSVSMAYFFEGLLAGLEKQISTPSTPI